MPKKKTRGRPKGSTKKKAEAKKPRGRPPLAGTVKKPKVGAKKKTVTGKAKLKIAKTQIAAVYKFMVVQDDGDLSTQIFTSKDAAVEAASEYAALYGCGYDLYSVKLIKSKSESEALADFRTMRKADKNHGKN